MLFGCMKKPQLYDWVVVLPEKAADEAELQSFILK